MISERLKAVAGMVTKGKKVADIGTDHGYVPIYLVENSICSKVYAMDINEGPLKIADKNIAIHGLSDKIETIQSNGMEKLKDNMVDGAIISGMGGDLIVNILKNGENEFLALIQSAINFSDYKIKSLKNGIDLNSEEEIAEYIEDEKVQ